MHIDLETKFQKIRREIASDNLQAMLSVGGDIQLGRDDTPLKYYWLSDVVVELAIAQADALLEKLGYMVPK